MNPNYQIIVSAKDQTKQAFDSISANVTRLNGAIGFLGVGISSAGLASLVKEAADFNDEMGDLAQTLGTTTERFSALKYAADIEGVFDELQTSMQKLAKTSEDAADGSKSAQESFAKLKIDPSQFKDTGDLFEQVVEQLSKLPDGAQKTAIALELLGKSGAKLIPAFGDGADSIKYAREEAEKFGLIVSQEAADAAGAFKDNLAELEAATHGLGVEFGNVLIPSLVEVSNKMLEAYKSGGLLKSILTGYGETFKVSFFGTEQEIDNQRLEAIKKNLLVIDKILTDGKEKKSNMFGAIIDLTPERIKELKDKALDLSREIQMITRKAINEQNIESTKNTPPTGKIDTQLDAERASKAALSARQREAEAASREARNFVENLQKEAAQLGLTKTEQTAYEASLLKLTATQKASVSGSIAKIEAYEREQVALKDLEEFQQLLRESDDRALEADIERADAEQKHLDEMQASYDDFYSRLLDQNEQLNIDLITNDKARAKAQLDLENERAIERIQSLMLEQDQIDALMEEQTKNYDLQLKKIEQSTDGAVNLGKELGRTFSSAFEDAALNGEDFGDTLDGLLKDLDRLALQAVTNPLFKAFQDYATEAASGIIFNAKGGVYSGSGISAYSNQVVSSPTMFPFAKGVGLMGEAGPEAIVPLKRTSNGALGIQTSGMGGNVTVNIIGAPTQPNIRKTQDDNGNTNIDVMFERVESYLGSRMAKGQGAIADVLSGGYGLNRGAGAQG